MLLTYLGQRLNVDIYLAAIVVFVGRMFTNLSMIRRYYLDKWQKRKQENIEVKVESEVKVAKAKKEEK